MLYTSGMYLLRRKYFRFTFCADSLTILETRKSYTMANNNDQSNGPPVKEVVLVFESDNDGDSDDVSEDSDVSVMDCMFEQCPNNNNNNSESEDEEDEEDEDYDPEEDTGTDDEDEDEDEGTENDSNVVLFDDAHFIAWAEQINDNSTVEMESEDEDEDDDDESFVTANEEEQQEEENIPFLVSDEESSDATVIVPIDEEAWFAAGEVLYYPEDLENENENEEGEEEEMENDDEGEDVNN